MFNEAMGKVFGWVLAFLISFGGAGAENLKISTTDGSAIAVVVDKMWDYFEIIGIGMTLVYFLLELNQRYALEGRDVTIKTFAVPFLKLLVAIAILFNSGKIIGWIFTWGNASYNAAAGFVGAEAQSAAVNSLSSALSAGDTITEADIALVKNAFGNSSAATNMVEVAGVFENLFGGPFAGVKLGASVVLLLMGVLMFLINLILSVVWTYKALAYKLEVLYRVGLTPIAMADIYSGHNSGAIRWIKGCIGLVLYGMSFVILPKLANVLAISQLTETLKGLFSLVAGDSWDLSVIIDWIVRLGACIAAPFAALGCLSAIRQLIKEATG